MDPAKRVEMPFARGCGKSDKAGLDRNNRHRDCFHHRWHRSLSLGHGLQELQTAEAHYGMIFILHVSLLDETFCGDLSI